MMYRINLRTRHFIRVDRAERNELVVVDLDEVGAVGRVGVDGRRVEP